MRKEMTDGLFKFLMGVLPLTAAMLLTGYAQPPTTLERVLETGELIVVTRVGPTTYYEDANGPAGFEYDLARKFAEHLGVDLKIVTPEHPEAILPMVVRREAHLAAAGLGVTAHPQQPVRFGPAYHESVQQLVYRRGTRRPGSLDDLAGTMLSSGRPVPQIAALLSNHPEVEWRPDPGAATEELLARLWHQEIPFLVADSNEVKVTQRFFPELRVAFDLTEPEPLAWAFPMGRDDSLIRAAEDFFARIEDNGQLAQLRERYYGHVDEFDYVGVRRFMRHIDQRLPKYADIFREAAEEHGHDWRLLAAIGYQESLWNPGAISPTGVRGIMMLTIRTASEMGVDDRIDPDNSIRGGARYLRQILGRLPQGIPEPDRTWFALAAYNIGFGHLEDARVLTQRRGGNPDRWMDVKNSLPLLTQKEWYKDTRFGYARGTEAVNYVQNIRGYYDMLVRQTTPRGDPPATTIASSRSVLELTAVPSPVL